jgi:hypothetical protein
VLIVAIALPLVLKRQQEQLRAREMDDVEMGRPEVK